MIISGREWLHPEQARDGWSRTAFPLLVFLWVKLPVIRDSGMTLEVAERHMESCSNDFRLEA